MSVRFKCPKCTTELMVDDSLRGNLVACSTCGGHLRVPNAPAPQALPPVRAAAPNISAASNPRPPISKPAADSAAPDFSLLGTGAPSIKTGGLPNSGKASTSSKYSSRNKRGRGKNPPPTWAMVLAFVCMILSIIGGIAVGGGAIGGAIIGGLGGLAGWLILVVARQEKWPPVLRVFCSIGLIGLMWITCGVLGMIRVASEVIDRIKHEQANAQGIDPYELHTPTFEQRVTYDHRGRPVRETIRRSPPSIRPATKPPNSGFTVPAPAPYVPPAPPQPSYVLPEGKVDQLLFKLRNPQHKLYREALNTLDKHFDDDMQSRREELAKAVEPFLKENDSFTTDSAARAMINLAGPENFDALVAALQSQSHFTRDPAITAIAVTRDPRAAEAILRVYVQHRHTATLALTALGPAAEPAVMTLLEHSEWSIRAAACDLLALIGTDRCRARLEQMAVSDESGFCHMTAKRALEQLKSR